MLKKVIYANSIPIWCSESIHWSVLSSVTAVFTTHPWFSTEESSIGCPFSETTAIVMYLPLPMTGTIFLHSSFHAPYCSLMPYGKLGMKWWNREWLYEWSSPQWYTFFDSWAWSFRQKCCQDRNIQTKTPKQRLWWRDEYPDIERGSEWATARTRGMNINDREEKRERRQTPRWIRLRTFSISKWPSSVKAACHLLALRVFPAWERERERWIIHT